MSKYVESREGHEYAPCGQERETPLEEIPPEFRKVVPLPGGRAQIVDSRLVSRFHPDKKRMMECGNTAASSDHDDVRRWK